MPKPLFTNHPYTEGPKLDPIHIKRDETGYFIYPDYGSDLSDFNQIYVSTDKMTICSMEIGPGGYFDPPDFHPGDEMYYVLNGTITQYQPILGQAIRVKQHESLMIPKGSAHQAYNFEADYVKILAVIAPKIVDDQLFPTEGAKIPKKLFMGSENHLNPPTPPLDHNIRVGTVDDIGSWPYDGPTLRKTGHLYHVTEDRKLLCVHGDKHPLLVKIAFSNDYMTTGEYILPFGGTTSRYTEPFQHEGQAFIYCVGERLDMYFPDRLETYVLRQGDGMFIPENTKYQMHNYSDKVMHAFFAVCPGIQK